jgi:hypothetical protein
MEIIPTNPVYSERDRIFISRELSDRIELRIGADRFHDPGSRRTSLTVEDVDCVIAALQWEKALILQHRAKSAVVPLNTTAGG